MPAEDSTPSPLTVAIVIPTYNDAEFLAAALQSAAHQTVTPDEIIVIDDGSAVSPAELVRSYGAILITQPNLGLAAARNAGMRAATSDKIIFLDADDVLEPIAIQAGRSAFELNPDAALVYGGFHRVGPDLALVKAHDFRPMSRSARRELLRANSIAMIGAVMIDRQKLLAVGGFDEGLGMCEDWDVYLRLSREFSIAGHAVTVASYRQRSQSLSTGIGALTYWAGVVREKERQRGLSPGELEAWEAGKVAWNRAYGTSLSGRGGQKSRRTLLRFASDMGVEGRLQRMLGERAAPLLGKIRRIVGRLHRPPLGAVRLGDLDRITPISSNFGYDRGTPIDRCYIEEFLSENAADIGGRVLEVGDATYSGRFATREHNCEVLNLRDGPGTTWAGNLADSGLLPAEAFDCAIITQTLHLIFDLHASVRNIHRALRPGGVVLATVPGISPVDRGEWGTSWCWSMTDQAVFRLFSSCFQESDVHVRQFGNVYAATCFLHGLALEEVDTVKLEAVDPAFPVIVAVRAVKR